MMTKKSDDFVKHALKQGKARFAVVGKGSSWTIYEGADLAKATANDGETLIKGSCQKKEKVLNFLIVGGTGDITVLKSKIFAAQVKADAKAFTFKGMSPQENGELEALIAELDGPLVEQIGQLNDAQQREAIVPLLNQARELAGAGDLGQAKAKVAELKSRMVTKGDSAEQADQRKKLVMELQSVLSETVGQLKNPQRETLAPVFNEALKLATEGDLKIAMEKVALLKKGLAAASAKPWQAAAQPTVNPTPSTRPTMGQRPLAATAESPGEESKALQAEITKLLKTLQTEWPDVAAQVVPSLKACLQETDAARQLERLRALRNETVELVVGHQALKDNSASTPKAAPKDAEQLQSEIFDLVLALKNSPLPSAQNAATLFTAKMRECLNESDADQRLKRLNALRSQANQLKVAVEIQTKQKEQVIDKLIKDFGEINGLLAELGFPPPLPGLKELRTRFQKIKDAATKTNAGAAAVADTAALLAELNKLPQVKQIKSDSAAKARHDVTQVRLMSAEDLKKLPVEKRIDLLVNLRRGGGKNNKDCREAMIKMQKAVPLEKDFKKKDSAMRKVVQDKLVGSEELRDARRKWSTLGNTEEDNKEKVKALEAALKIQCDVMREKWGVDVAMPPLELYKAGPSGQDELTGEEQFESGNFVPETGKIKLNSQAPSFKDFDSVLNTIIHENTHNFQHALVEALEAGQIDKDTEPEKYNQAVLFQLNMPPLGYLNPEDGDAYELQSTERHAYKAGNQAAELGQRFEQEDKYQDEAERLEVARNEAKRTLANIEMMSMMMAVLNPDFEGMVGIQADLEAAMKSNSPEEIRVATGVAFDKAFEVSNSI